MDKFLTFTIGGLATAAIYAISASGLVVTYTTSGIFNFAHGAFSMMAAFMFWQVHVAWGVPVIPAVILVVFVIGPLFGAAIERVIMRGIEGTTDVVKIVVTISLMIALIGLANVIWDPNVGRPVQAQISGVADILGVPVSYQRILTMVVAAIVAGALAFMFKYTRLGIGMRAVVDDRSLMMLNGGRPGRISMMSWALGAGMAAISGVLLASEQTLSATTLTLLFINAYAVAVVGRLRSLPGVFLGAVILGLAQSYVIGYLDQSATIGPISLRAVAQALPAIMLFVVMVLQPQDRLVAKGSTRRTTPSRPPSQQFALVGGLVFVIVVAALGSLVSGPNLNLLLGGFFTAVVTLSLVPLTGYAGQISLAQLTFTGIGAVAMATWGANGEPWAVLLAVGLCAVVGGIVAFPALRLSGIYLALATAAFALFCSSMVFNQTTVMPGANRQVPRLSLGPLSIDSDYSQLVLFAVLFAVIGNGLILLRRSSWGRRLTAMKDSPMACATLGLNLTSTKVGVFALSAAIAGAAGAVSGRTFLADSLSLPGSLSITMIAVVGGIGSVAGAFFGGLLLGAFPIFSTMFAANAVGIFGFVSLSMKDVLAFSPGMMGISLGRDPDGAAPQLAAGFKAVGQSVPTLAVTAVGSVALWVITRVEMLDKWSFVAAMVVFVFAMVPLTPLVFAPPEMPGRRWAMELWLAVAVVVAAVIPWATVIESNGMRVVLIIVYTLLTARIAMGVHGAAMDMLPGGAPTETTSPDEMGLHAPLTYADALDAGRALGIDEELLAARNGAAPAPSSNGTGRTLEVTS
jgi:branched-chain amino acid transport system permease protein